MSRRIGVLGVCDSGALALSLSLIAPNETVEVVNWQEGPEEQQETWLLNMKQHFDILLVNQTITYRLKNFNIISEKMSNITVYPHIHFHAFHPDMTYASRIVNNEHELLKTGYNSSIALWCYKNGLTPEKAATFFCGDVFEQLGYFDEWEASVELLRSKFSELHLDFRRFFERAKRDGIFMLSFNHPRVAAISALAAQIAMDFLEISESLASIPIYIADHLAQSHFPVYPEIGDYYGQKTIYDFYISGKKIGLLDYIRWAYSQYDLVTPKSAEFFYGRPGQRSKLDAVLRERLG